MRIQSSFSSVGAAYMTTKDRMTVEPMTLFEGVKTYMALLSGVVLTLMALNALPQAHF